MVQECYLDFRVFLRERTQRHDEAFNQISLFDDVGEVHKSLHEIKFIIGVEILDVLFDRLG